MSVDVVDVEESDIECLVVAIPAIVVIMAAPSLEDVDSYTVVANNYGGIGGGQENDWEKEGSELHGGPTDRRKGSREELAPGMATRMVMIYIRRQRGFWIN